MGKQFGVLDSYSKLRLASALENMAGAVLLASICSETVKLVLVQCMMEMVARYLELLKACTAYGSYEGSCLSK